METSKPIILKTPGSEVIFELTYIFSKKQLQVKFKHNRATHKYHYDNIPYKIYKLLANSKSTGWAYNRYIKGRKPSRKLKVQS